MSPSHVLFNPASGSYSPSRAEHILALLRAAGMDPQPLLPRSEEEARSAVRALCQGGQRPLIIAAGGDGTVNTVINGMEPQSATLSVIPLGTANVFGRELGITSLHDAVARIVAGTGRSFSVGEVVSAAGTRRFMLMAGIGIDGAIVSGVRAGEKRWLGKLAYLLSALRELRAWNRNELTVSDGVRSVVCHTVVIANAAHYGGPYILAPGATIFNPVLDVVPLTISSRRRFFHFASTLIFTGKAPPVPGAWQFGAGQLTIAGDKAIQLDGDEYGIGPLTIKLVPNFNEMQV